MRADLRGWQGCPLGPVPNVHFMVKVLEGPLLCPKGSRFLGGRVHGVRGLVPPVPRPHFNYFCEPVQVVRPC